jgi:hypothetical protein
MQRGGVKGAYLKRPLQLYSRLLRLGHPSQAGGRGARMPVGRWGSCGEGTEVWLGVTLLIPQAVCTARGRRVISCARGCDWVGGMLRSAPLCTG